MIKKSREKRLETKIIFVTGGVCSSLGKGIVAASTAAILKSAGKKVSIMKLDPYLNVDPGTMSPFQHGEVFVLDDGGETDFYEVDRKTLFYSVKPKPGRGGLFDSQIYHCGNKVTKGCKYLLRTDVMVSVL